MSDFKAKMHKIQFPFQTPLRELTLLPQTLELYLRGLLLRGWRGNMEERGSEGNGRKGGASPPIFWPRTTPEEIAAVNRENNSIKLERKFLPTPLPR